MSKLDQITAQRLRGGSLTRLSSHDKFPTLRSKFSVQVLRNPVPRIITVFFVTAILSGCFAGAKKTRVLERADRYFKAGEYDNAKIEYLNLLRLDNQNVTAFQQLGFIWLEQGVPLRAIPFLLKVRELAPNNIPARTKLAHGLIAMNQLAEGRKEALFILERDPDNSDAIVALADASRSNEEIAAAEQQLQKFSQKNTAAFHLAAASVAMRKGDLSAASDEIQQAVAVDPKSARAHLVMAYVYLLRKNPKRCWPRVESRR